MSIFPIIVALTWLGFIAYWIFAWRGVKPSKEKNNNYIILRIYVAVFIIGMVLIARHFNIFLHIGIPSPNTNFAIGLLASVLSVGGLVIAIIARRQLGGNWSPQVELKKGHELITTGLYGVVRHPIYLGLYLIALGTLLIYPSLNTFTILVIAGVVFAVRIKKEEALMTKTFPREYPGYKKRTKALIPFVW